MSLLSRVTTALVVAVLTAGCGLPHDGSPRRIDSEDVPYNLISEPSPAPAPTAGVRPRPAEPKLFWVTSGGAVVPGDAASTCDLGVETLVSDLLEELEAGPTEAARRHGLATALAPDTSLELADLSSNTAAVHVDPGAGVGAERLPLGVAQIVLTVTSVPGIDQVQLVHEGEPLQVPLPGGALTSTSVAATDYDDFVPRRHRRSLGRGDTDRSRACGAPGAVQR